MTSDEQQQGGAPAWAPGYRHLTADIVPVSFLYRGRPQDFIVEEVPLEPPSGEGTHVFLELEKRGVSTVDAVRRLARALDRPERDFGFAGRKDAFAWTRQWISIEHADPALVQALELADMRVLQVTRHTKKLRLGQLAGNRFRLRLVGLAAADCARFEEVLGVLVRRGIPNYYGAQRFGRHGATDRLGRLLVLRRYTDYLEALLSPEHTPAGEALEELDRVFRTGTASAQRRLGRLAPRLPVDLAAVARQLARRPGDHPGAVRAVPKRTRRFHVSAFQSKVFNTVLAARLGAGLPLDALVPGDVAFEHGSGRVFPVSPDEPPAAELAARTAAFELSPSGPMPGARMLQSAGVPAELEASALEVEQVALSDFENLPEGFAQNGVRRPLRVPLTELETTWSDGGGELCFRLPKGAYATTLLEEARKEYLTP